VFVPLLKVLLEGENALDAASIINERRFGIAMCPLAAWANSLEVLQVIVHGRYS
jgi:hypothetical protein